MEDGLFFWLIIMAVAVLQGIGARKKKAGQQGKKPGMPGQKSPASGQTPPPPGQTPPPPGQSPQTPGQRPRLPAASRPARASIPQGEGAEEGGSSEGMIPSEVWAEILGLARGDPQPAEAEVESEPEPDLVPAPRPFPTSHGAGAVLHETEPAAFESRLAVSRLPASEPGSEEKGRVRAKLFGTGSPRELRKAIILQEVLGTPVGLKGEGK